MNALQVPHPSLVPPPPAMWSRVCGAGEMADLIRQTDWYATALGDPAFWPESLLATVNLILSSPIPTSVYWGPHHVLLYNDGYRQFLADRHPQSLGKSGADVWKEAWHIVGPQIEHTYRTAEAFHGESSLVPIEQDGHLVDRYWDYSFSPIYDSRTGTVAGIYNTCSDVTGAFRTMQERDSLAQRLQELLETTSESVIMIDRSWRFTYLNRAAEVFSMPYTGLVGQVIWDALPGLVYDGSPNVHHYHRAMEHGESSEFDSYYPEPINRWRHIQVRPTADGIVLFARDITEQRRADAAIKASNDALAASEEELRWTIGLSSQFPWIADPDGHILKNRGDVTTLTGHAVEEVLGDDWTKMMLPEDAARMQQVWAQCVRTGKLYDIEHRVVTRTGELRWFRSRAFPRRDMDGKIVKWYGITDDIDEQKRRAAALEQTATALAASEEELRWTIQLSAQIPWTAAPDGSLLTISERWFEMTGTKREEVLGSGWVEVQHKDDLDRVVHSWSHSTKTGEPFDVEHRVRLASGEFCWIRSRALPRRDSKGSIVRWYGTMEDIHACKVAEEGLRTSEKLAAVGRLATSIAHEINNPLEAVTNLLYLARTSEQMPDIQGYIRNAEEELHRASVIANQTLRFQRQSSSAIALGSEDLIENCLAVFQGKLQNASVAPEKRLRAKRPVTCYDGEIRQVFLNLVGNAIDAMQPGGGRLLIRTREATHPVNGKDGLVLTVADTGSGISTEALKKIFEPFFTTKGIGGTGLGLWVTKDIVARHHGTLRVRSKTARRKTDLDVHGKAAGGTVFTLFLPFDAVLRHAPARLELVQRAA